MLFSLLKYFFDLYIADMIYSESLLVKRPLWDACLCMGDLQAPPAPRLVFLITLKFGRFMQ